MYDFGGMDKSHRPFRELTPDEGHVVKSISFAPTNEAYVVATGSAAPRVGQSLR